MNVPALRFSEFEGEWLDSKLSEIADVYDGTHQTPTYVKSGVPFVSVENIADLKSTTKYISEAAFEKDFKTKPQMGDVMMTRITAGIIGATAIVQDDEPLAYYVSLALIRGQQRVDPNFLGQRIESTYFKRELHKRIIHVAFPKKINLGDLGDCRAIVPSLPEQKKIAAFLGVVDAKIAALRARRAGLTRYKRGLMQALFSQTLRFTKPDGTAFPDWEEKRLGEVATRSTVKNTKLEYMRVLTNSAVRGVIDQGDYFDKDIANAENLAGYYVLKKGDFVYNPRISVSAPVGPIKRNDLGDGVMSPLYTVFHFKEKDTEFFNVFFATTVWHKYMKAVANYGARHDRMAITSGDLMKLPLPYPHPDEQAKIAEALQAMDAKIAAVSGQLEKMQDFKKGLLQQMFV